MHTYKILIIPYEIILFMRTVFKSNYGGNNNSKMQSNTICQRFFSEHANKRKEKRSINVACTLKVLAERVTRPPTRSPRNGLCRSGARSMAVAAEITPRPPTTVTRSGRYGSPIRE